MSHGVSKDDVKKSVKFFVMMFLFELLIILGYGLGSDYTHLIGGANNDGGMGFYYSLFTDVHAMIYIGFGFLMIFTRSYSWSSVCLNFVLAALAFQWSLLTIGFFHNAGKSNWGDFEFDIKSLIGGDFAAGAVLITFGAVLGKTSAIQMIAVVFFEIIVYSINEMCVVVKLHAIDMGGSMVIHAFGAFFGLGLSWALGYKLRGTGSPAMAKWSSTTAIIGTLTLWVFWPSFNGALASGGQQHRVIINTLLSISGSTMSTFALSRLLRPGKKFDFEDIANATLAGGVAVGSSADLVIRPWGALLIGNVAGALSTFGFNYVTPWVNDKLGIHDTCGVLSLHGLPGILGGMSGAISAAIAGESSYGQNIALIFPARAPSDPVAAAAIGAAPGLDRSAGMQGNYQAAAIFVSVGFAIVGGAITGFIVKQPFFEPPTKAFDDNQDWHLPEDLSQDPEAGVALTAAAPATKAIEDGDVEKAVELTAVKTNVSAGLTDAMKTEIMQMLVKEVNERLASSKATTA